MSELDDVRTELASIQERLLALPDDAFDERARLRSRREELRAQAAVLADREPAARSELEAELDGLVARWEQITAQHIDPIQQAGDANSGGNFAFATDAMRINRALDENANKAQVEARIKEIKAKLAAMDG